MTQLILQGNYRLEHSGGGRRCTILFGNGRISGFFGVASILVALVLVAVVKAKLSSGALCSAVLVATTWTDNGPCS